MDFQKCQRCWTQKALFRCPSCDKYQILCNKCDAYIHSMNKFKFHQRFGLSYNYKNIVISPVSNKINKDITKVKPIPSKNIRKKIKNMKLYNNNYLNKNIILSNKKITNINSNNIESETNFEAVTSIRTQETKDNNKNRIKPIPLNLKSIISDSNYIPSGSGFTNNDDFNNNTNVIEMVTSVRTKTSQEESHSNFEVNLDKINEIQELESNITDQINF